MGQQPVRSSRNSTALTNRLHRPTVFQVGVRAALCRAQEAKFGGGSLPLRPARGTRERRSSSELPTETALPPSPASCLCSKALPLSGQCHLPTLPRHSPRGSLGMRVAFHHTASLVASSHCVPCGFITLRPLWLFITLRPLWLHHTASLVAFHHTASLVALSHCVPCGFITLRPLRSPA